MTKILITGGKGMVGSRVVEILREKYDTDTVSRSSGLDITNRDSVFEYFKTSEAKFILHLAAKADVDGCEADKNSDIELLKSSDDENKWEETPSAYAINVYGTKNVALGAAEFKKKLIYISTDFVFDGEKEDPYSEEDKPNPVNWYAKTKYLGEEAVEENSSDYIIARLSYPFREKFEKKDFVRAIAQRFREGLEVKAVTDHIMTPTFVDDFANSLDVLITSNVSGIFHTVGSSFISPWEAAIKIAEVFGFDENLIKETTREEFFQNRARRPFHLALNNDKIGNLGVKFSTFEEGLEKIKNNI